MKWFCIPGVQNTAIFFRILETNGAFFKFKLMYIFIFLTISELSFFFKYLLSSCCRTVLAFSELIFFQIFIEFMLQNICLKNWTYINNEKIFLKIHLLLNGRQTRDFHWMPLIIYMLLTVGGDSMQLSTFSNAPLSYVIRIKFCT